MGKKHNQKLKEKKIDNEKTKSMQSLAFHIKEFCKELEEEDNDDQELVDLFLTEY